MGNIKQTEVEEIYKKLNNNKTLILYSEQSGMGKSWLIENLKSKIQSADNCSVICLLDLYYHNTKFGVINQITENLTNSDNKHLLSQTYDLLKNHNEDELNDFPKDLTQNLEKVFIDDLNKLLSTKKTYLFFDSFEYVIPKLNESYTSFIREEDRICEWLLKTFDKLKDKSNLHLSFVGREIKQYFIKKNRYHDDIFYDAKSFDEQEVQEYLKRTKHSEVSDIATLIYQKSEGRQIVVCMLTSYVVGCMERFKEYTFEDFKKEIQNVKNEDIVAFLIKNLHKLTKHYGDEEIILLMSVANKKVNVELASSVLFMATSDAKLIIDAFKTNDVSFIKRKEINGEITEIRLHDEVRDHILKHAKFDKQLYLNKTIDYLQSKIKDKATQQWQDILDLLEYQFDADNFTADAQYHWLNQFLKAQDTSISMTQKLIELIERKYNKITKKDNFNSFIPFFLEVFYHVRYFYNNVGVKDISFETEIEKLVPCWKEEKPNSQLSNKEKGLWYLLKGQKLSPKKVAIEYFKKANTYFILCNDKIRAVNACHWLGFVYQRHSELEESRRWSEFVVSGKMLFYEEGLTKNSASNENDYLMILYNKAKVKALSNLSYNWHQSGNLLRAIQYAEHALAISRAYKWTREDIKIIINLALAKIIINYDTTKEEFYINGILQEGIDDVRLIKRIELLKAQKYFRQSGVPILINLYLKDAYKERIEKVFINQKTGEYQPNTHLDEAINILRILINPDYRKGTEFDILEKIYSREECEAMYLLGKIHHCQLLDDKTINFEESKRILEKCKNAAKGIGFSFLEEECEITMQTIAFLERNKTFSLKSVSSLSNSSFFDIRLKSNLLRGNDYFGDLMSCNYKKCTKPNLENVEKQHIELFDFYFHALLEAKANSLHRYNGVQKLIKDRLGEFSKKHFKETESVFNFQFLEQSKTFNLLDENEKKYFEKLFKIANLPEQIEKDKALINNSWNFHIDCVKEGEYGKALRILNFLIYNLRNQVDENVEHFNVALDLAIYSFELIYIYQIINSVKDVEREIATVRKRIEKLQCSEGEKSLLHAIIDISEATKEYRNTEFWNIESILFIELEKYKVENQGKYSNTEAKYERSIETIKEFLISDNTLNEIDKKRLKKIQGEGYFRLGELNILDKNKTPEDAKGNMKNCIKIVKNINNPYRHLDAVQSLYYIDYYSNQSSNEENIELLSKYKEIEKNTMNEYPTIKGKLKLTQGDRLFKKLYNLSNKAVDKTEVILMVEYYVEACKLFQIENKDSYHFKQMFFQLTKRFYYVENVEVCRIILEIIPNVWHEYSELKRYRKELAMLRSILVEKCMGKNLKPFTNFIKTDS